MKKKASYLIFILVLLFLSGCNDHFQHNSSFGTKDENKPLILMVIAPNNFKDEEFFIPKEEFELKGYKVLVASSQETANSILKRRVKVDLLINESPDIIDNISALVFPGGPGVSVYYNNSLIKRIILEAYQENKTIGAICLAPIILSKAGILNGKKATVWDHSFITTLEEGGAIYSSKGVVVDNNIITSNSPKHAKEFADTILGLLQNNKG